MKYRSAKLFRITVALLVLLGMLAAAGCGKKPKKELPMPDITLPSTESTEQTEPEPTQEVPQDASLVSLRQAMVGTDAKFAVAYFGYIDMADPEFAVDPYDVMQERTPLLCEDHPWLLEIPETNIVGEDRGDLFAILPLDPDAEVTVSVGAWTGEETVYEEASYTGNGNPILLICNGAGWEPDMQLYISGPSGDALWYPMLDDTHCAAPMEDANWQDQFLDFSAYAQLLSTEYFDMMDAGWEFPTAEMLIGTDWSCEEYLKDGRHVRHRIEFAEDTCYVRWNDGYEDVEHEYYDAPWELTYDEGFAILEIDFQEFAGVLRYNLLYREDYDMLYTQLDVSTGEAETGWEAQYRFLVPAETEAPNPLDMAGTWELAWTEFEGYQENAEPGSNIIEIAVDEADSLWISFSDYAHPDEYYADKELVISPYEMYYGCGNDQWTATVNHTGKFDTEYSVTLLYDGMLLLQRYYELDGAPTVSYGWYYRVY